MICLLSAGPFLGAFRAPQTDENVLKAQALVELAPFFKRPERRDPGQAFAIAVLGKSPFGPTLDNYAKNRTVQGRPIVIHYVARPSELPLCDLIFICRSERRTAPEILNWARGRGVLTVSDDEDLLYKGIMVGLIPEAGFLKIFVNARRGYDEKFVISSQLLHLAKIIDLP